MKITLSTIMRDGEPYVEYACRSTFPYADKIVICDTGSKDNTPDIIRAVAKEFDKELVLLFTEWKGYGPARELCMPYIEDGWLWKIGHDEVWFRDRAERIRQSLTFWAGTKVEYLYPTEYTMEGSHVTRQGQMNCRSQFYKIDNTMGIYTWGNMTTNDDLTRVNRFNRRDQLFLGPLCGDVNTVCKDPRFTGFINPGPDLTGSGFQDWTSPPQIPDSIHFAKCSSKRIVWKTMSYRQIVSDWPEEGMGDPRAQVPYLGPWPEVLYKTGPYGQSALVDFLAEDFSRLEELLSEDNYQRYVDQARNRELDNQAVLNAAFGGKIQWK